ncbi:MAG: MoaD/ThiS family protein [Acidobacteria bacterium]|nr:MoaD/ThiS family protein [Acidobacteriota bacterium]
MPSVHFTPNLRRHLRVDSAEVEGHTVSDALSRVFRDNPDLRSYVLDDQGRLRTHVVIYVDGRAVRDRTELGDAVGEGAEIHVMQALSGG